MKALHLLAILSMGCLMPSRLAATELEDLRARCKEQEKTISALQEQLRSLKGEPAPATTPAEPAATPTEPTATPAEPTTATVEASTETYTVVAGDSLEKIARNTNCSAKALAEVNGLTLNSMIRAGQKLKLPAGATASTSTPAPTPTPAPAAPTTKPYKIADGDTYFSLARKLKISAEKLMAANPNIKASQLYAGRTIQIPVTPEAPPPTNNTAKENSTTTDNTPPKTPAEPEKKIRSIKIKTEITYSEFAAQYGTDIKRLNNLNGLDLTGTTVLAKGSELYVPAQP